MIAAGPNSSTGVLSESLSYRVTESGKTLEAGVTLAGLSGIYLISQTAIKALLGTALTASGVLIKSIYVSYYQATAMWTKTVHVNGIYQYYAGKDTTYPVLAFVDACTPLEVGVTTAHPDFANNDGLMQKGFDNYLMSL